MNPGIHERVRMWMANAPAAMMALRTAEPSGDWSSLVVVIADMRDPVARQLFETFAAKEGFDSKREEAKVEAKGQIPTGTMVITVEAAQGIFQVLDHPQVAANVMKDPPVGRVRAIVISSGAVSLMHPPVIEIPEAAKC